MNVVIYARHSSDKQNQSSSKDQITRCEEWCQEQKHNIVKVYLDEAITGSTFGRRVGISELLKDATSGAFDIVVCEDLSRLSRDQGDTANFHKRMSFIGIKIYSLTEGFIDRVNVGLKGIMNELYLEQLADKTLRGNIASAKKGNVPGGKVYGYDPQTYQGTDTPIPGKRKINKKEAEIIQDIFFKASQNRPIKEIVDFLNDTNIPSPSGKKWHVSTLTGTASRQAGILRQTLYKGVLTFNKQTYKVDPSTGKKRSFPNPKEDWVTADIPELTIIEPSLFDKVQYVIGSQKRFSSSLKLTSQIAEEKKKKSNQKYSYDYTQKKYAVTETKNRSIITGKSHCHSCKTKLKVKKGGWLACRTEECVMRDGFERLEIIKAAFAALEEVNIRDLISIGARDPHKLADMKELRLRLIEERAEARQKIENVILLFKNDEVGEQTRKIIDELETVIKKITLKIEKLERDIKTQEPVTEQDASIIEAVYRNVLFDYKNQPGLKKTQHILRRLIRKYYVTRTANQTYYAKAVVNEKELIEYRHSSPLDFNEL